MFYILRFNRRQALIMDTRRIFEIMLLLLGVLIGLACASGWDVAKPSHSSNWARNFVQSMLLNNENPGVQGQLAKKLRRTTGNTECAKNDYTKINSMECDDGNSAAKVLLPAIKRGNVNINNNNYYYYGEEPKPITARHTRKPRLRPIQTQPTSNPWPSF